MLMIIPLIFKCQAPRISIVAIIKYLFMLSSMFILCSGALLGSQGLELPGAYEEKSNDLELRNTNICDICDDLLGHIGTYLTNPVASLGLLNKRLFALFHEKYSLKYYVMSRFDIPELKSVHENSFELHEIIKLNWCSDDPLLLFGSLMADIINDRRSYENIIHSLYLYFERTLRGLSKKQRNYYKINLSGNLRDYFGRFCTEKGLYSMAIEFLNDKPVDFINCISRVENKNGLMEFFKLNPDSARQYQNFFLNDRMANNYRFEAGKWIAECIIYDLPEEFYIELLRI
jgi:hypothetical protein